MTKSERSISFPTKPTHHAFKNLTGQRFGRWTVVEYAGTFTSSQSAHWLVQCECLQLRVINGLNLRLGRSASCGCAPQKPRKSSSAKKHRPLYKVWRAMKARCVDPKFPGFSRWGGRGISVCALWNRSLDAFTTDMGDRPKGDYTLDRIDNDGGYWCGHCDECIELNHPANCRWATRQEQLLNRSNTRWLTIGKHTQPLLLWCQDFDIPYDRVYSRLRNGWDAYTALTAPLIPKKTKTVSKESGLSQKR